jgi:lysophospholipase L1-like esterase
MANRIGPPAAALLFSVLLLVGGAHAGASEKPAYLALGDSLAFGVGAANPVADGYVGLTHFQLESSVAYRQSGLELLNVSEPGATSAGVLEPDGQMQKALEHIANRANDSITGNEVELISIDIGGNDLLQLAEPDAPCIKDSGSQACRASISEMLSGLQANLGIILRRLRDAAPDARIFVIDLFNPYSGSGDQRELIANFAVQQVNGVTNATASDPDLDVTLVPIFELFQGRGSQWISPDHIHPNDAGHRVMAEALLAAIDNRPVEVPDELAGVPTGSPGPAAGDGIEGLVPDDDDPLLPLVVAVPLAFLAGIVLSTTYFWVRGRR